MSAPDFLPRTRASGDFDEDQQYREMAAYLAYCTGDGGDGPNAVEQAPDDADQSYLYRWRASLAEG